MIKYIILSMILILSVCYAQNEDGGEAGAFLENGMGAKASSMGGAFVSLADDANAVYWNPAGLAQIKQLSADFMYASPMSEIDGVDYYTFAVSYPTEIGIVGLGLIHFSVADIPITSDRSGPTGETFSNTETAIFVSYGMALDEAMSIGLSLKILNHAVYEYSATGYGIDLGFLYRFSDRLRLGIQLNNLMAPSLQLNNEIYSVPLKLNTGLSYKLFDVFTMVTDFKFAGDKSIVIKPGMELGLWQNILFVRQGYSMNTDEWSLGLGINYGGYKMDYGYSTHPWLGYTNRFGIGITF